MSQAGKLEEAGPFSVFSVIKCPCVAGETWKSTGTTYSSVRREQGLATQECPTGCLHLELSILGPPSAGCAVILVVAIGMECGEETYLGGWKPGYTLAHLLPASQDPKPFPTVVKHFMVP